jgi:predicted lysophospholipase L1 biosynthesis ABC-type transport system permease subunit
VLPIAFVIGLVATLEVAIITPMNAFEATTDVYIRPLEILTIVTPLSKSDFDEALTKQLDDNPHMERRLRAKTVWIDTPAIIGELTSPLIALTPDDQPEFLRRMGLELVEGKLPEEASPGAAVHKAILDARGMKIGDEFGRLVNLDDRTPGRFEVVGVLDGESRVGLVDLGYASVPTFVLARRPAFQAIYAKPGEKRQSDEYLRGVKDAEGRKAFRVVDERWARELAEKSLKNLPLIVGFITLLDALIVGFVVMLINVISFQARTDEFALYMAVGHRRGRLVRKLTAEATLTSLLGWLIGVVLGLGIVALYDELVLDPRAIVIRRFDPEAILYTTMVPILSALASAVALSLRLRRMDPVAVIQRRGG